MRYHGSKQPARSARPTRNTRLVRVRESEFDLLCQIAKKTDRTLMATVSLAIRGLADFTPAVHIAEPDVKRPSTSRRGPRQ